MVGPPWGYVDGMADEVIPRLRRRRWLLATFVFRFPQVHIVIGVLGNALFVVGALLFMLGRESVGHWLFLVGSCGMFLGSLGEGLRALGRRRLVRLDVDPGRPDHSWSLTQGRSSPLD